LEALKAMDLRSVSSEGYGFQIEMAARVMRAGGKVVEVPITFSDRTRGASKLSGRIVVEALVLCASLWWQRRRDRRPKTAAAGDSASPAWRCPTCSSLVHTATTA
jgi:hypothetical protein